MKKVLIGLLKVGISLGILGYLVFDAWRDGTLKEVWGHTKNWGFLALAWGFCASAVVLTLIRWCYLVRALGVPFSLKDALRLGFVGYLFNLAPMGIVGGDLLKAIMLAREQRSPHAQAFATVVVDRLIGLYMLFVVATPAIFLLGYWQTPIAALQAVCRLAVTVAVAGALGIGLLMVPALTEGRVIKALERLPRMGRHIASLVDALRMYRSKPHVLLAAALMSAGVHCCFASGAYLISRALVGEVHSLATHLVIMPLSAAAGVIPLPWGPFEGTLKVLYALVPALPGAVATNSQGLTVALVYRMATLLIAAAGIGYYLTSRREVSEVMQEAEEHDEVDLPLVTTEGGPVAPIEIGA